MGYKNYEDLVILVTKTFKKREVDTAFQAKHCKFCGLVDIVFSLFDAFEKAR